MRAKQKQNIERPKRTGNNNWSDFTQWWLRLHNSRNLSFKIPPNEADIDIEEDFTETHLFVLTL